MPTLQEQYDDAMFDFSTGDYDSAIAKMSAVLAEDPAHFEAQHALGMAYYRKGDYAAAIAAGHKAEQLKPHEQLVHTNLSLFYMKAGDKKTAEHHGLQARIASWKADKSSPAQLPADGQRVGPGSPPLPGGEGRGEGENELQMVKPKTPPPPQKFPDMP